MCKKYNKYLIAALITFTFSFNLNLFTKQTKDKPTNGVYTEEAIIEKNKAKSFFNKTENELNQMKKIQEEIFELIKKIIAIRENKKLKSSERIEPVTQLTTQIRPLVKKVENIHTAILKATESAEKSAASATKLAYEQNTNSTPKARNAASQANSFARKANNNLIVADGILEDVLMRLKDAEGAIKKIKTNIEKSR